MGSLHIKSAYPHADLILAGDFNARTKDYMDFIIEDEADHIFGQHAGYPTDDFSMARKNKDIDFSNAYGLSLVELCCTFSVHILNGRLFDDKEGNFTCFANNGTSVVDYMVASTTLFPKVSNFVVDDFDISDHLPICCTLTLKERRRSEEVKNTQENQTNAWVKYKWNSDFKDAFLTKFRDNYRAFQNNFVNEEISLVDLLPEFINIFQKSAENMKYQRKKTTRKRQPDWWDAECDQAKRSKNLLLRLFRERNTRNYLEEYLYKRKQFKIIVKRKKINFKRRNKKNLIDSRNCLKKFWKNIKANKVKRNDTNMIEPSAWYQYFKKLLGPQNNTEAVENGNNDLLAGIRQDNNSDDLNSLITDDEVKQSISRLHANKAPGPDGLPAEFFKCTSEFTSPYLTIVFNNILANGIIPDDWGKSIICPLHKKGSVYDPNNFRGISLINTVCKIFTNILVTRLDKWTEKFNVIHESQAGFRRNYSTIDNIFTLHALVQKYLNKKRGRFYTLFIDFRKAFDSIKHDKLWDALERKGIGGNFLNV